MTNTGIGAEPASESASDSPTRSKAHCMPRQGNLHATIFENRGPSGSYHTVDSQRRHMDKDEKPHVTHSFKPTDMHDLLRQTAAVEERLKELAQARSRSRTTPSHVSPVLIGTIRRECLDRTLFWTAADLEMKLLDFQRYFNGHRTHAGLQGRTPEPSTNAGGALASVSSYRWQSHCRGLYQTPMAADAYVPLMVPGKCEPREVSTDWTSRCAQP
jgi:hypothetical protein